jgi:hypothetical protein
VINRLP